MKFTFKSEFVGFGSPETSMQFEADDLGDVLNYFKQFLQGAGYVIDGELDVVPNEVFYGENNHIDVDMDGRC